MRKAKELGLEHPKSCPNLPRADVKDESAPKKFEDPGHATTSKCAVLVTFQKSTSLGGEGTTNPRVLGIGEAEQGERSAGCKQEGG